MKQLCINIDNSDDYDKINKYFKNYTYWVLFAFHPCCYLINFEEKTIHISYNKARNTLTYDIVNSYKELLTYIRNKKINRKSPQIQRRKRLATVPQPKKSR